MPACGATTGPLLLGPLLPPGRLLLAEHSVTVKLTAFHTPWFWGCPGTSEHALKCLSISSNHIQGFTSGHQLVLLSAFQPDSSQVFPRYEAWQLRDPQVSSWLQHPRTSTDKDFWSSEIVRFRMARDLQKGFGRLKIELTPSSQTLNIYGCFNTRLFLTSASLC